ncbi:MAG: hypothetical protein C0394_01850 [Syntrophus sp. (in: bacteria)]|nr:hypothetical protein [Syntrophus sp. (in: bacteria)]
MKMPIVEQHELYRILTEQSFAGIYVVHDGKFRYLNNKAASYAGYTPDELLGRPLVDIVHPEDKESARRDARAMLLGKKTSPSEFRVLTKDGQVRWIMETIAPITWEGKSAILGNSMDITERKHFEAALGDRQERYRILFEGAGDAIFLLEDYRFVDCNPKTFEMFQCEREQMIGQTPARFSPPLQPDGGDSIQKAIEKMNGALTGESQFFEWRHCRHNGTPFDAEVRLSRLELPGKQLIQATVRDISSRKRIEKALKESEERFRTLIEATKDLVFVVNARGRFTYANPRFEEMLGHEPQELMEKPFTFIIASESKGSVIDQFNNGMKGQDSPAYEALLLHKNGKRIPVEFVATTMRDEEGNAVGRFGIGRDITERKRAEEATRESYERLSDIINFLPDATFAVDLEGRVIAWNLAIEQMTGIKKQDMIGRGDYEYALPFYGVRRPLLIDMVLKPDADIEKNYLLLSRDKGSVIAESVSRHLVPGRNVYLWIKASPVCDVSGNIVGAIETIRDITQRKQAEDDLKQSEERYRTIIENIGDGYYEVDLKGKVTFLNDAALRILSITRNEVQGYNFKAFAAKEDAAAIFGAFHEVYLTGTPFRGVSWRAVRPDGREQHVEVSVSLIRDAAGRPAGFRGILHDITERRKAEKAMQHMAYHDPLTGLPNRLLFYDRFSQIMAHARRNREQFAVVMLDLDKFKEINDRLGHDVGDQLLRSVAERFRSQMRDGDTVARFGGDEFLMLLPGMKQIEDLGPLGQKVVQTFQQPFPISEQELSVYASVGVAVFPDDGADRDILVQKADFAMYRVKAAGGNRWMR